MNYKDTNDFCECSDCGRKILVIRLFWGVPHSSVASVTCGECLAKKGIPEKWTKDNPERAKKLQEWLDGIKTDIRIRTIDPELLCVGCGERAVERFPMLEVPEGGMHRPVIKKGEWYRCDACNLMWDDSGVELKLEEDNDDIGLPIDDMSLICPECDSSVLRRYVLYASDGLSWYKCLGCKHEWSDMDNRGTES